MSKLHDRRRPSSAWRRWAKRELVSTMGNRCRLCFRNFSYTDLTLDHIKPLSKGGQNVIENVQLLCEPCHIDKDQHLGRKIS